MKRHLITACLTTACLFSTGLATANAAQSFRAGAAAVDVTPTKFPVIVNGMFNERTANRAHDRLMSRALVLDDGQMRLAIVVVDSLMIPRELLDAAKQMAAKATGIPAERMLISATHTHSAPSAMGCLGSRADPEYSQFLPGQIAKSIVFATERLAPARIGWNVVKDYEHNHCRRWIFRPDRVRNDPFGVANVRAMMHPGYQSANHTSPSGPVDPDLSLLAVQTADGKPLAVLANYPLHYKGSPLVSGDFCGRFGAAFAKLIGADDDRSQFVGIMPQGTSGDSMWMDYSRPPNDPGLDGYTAAVAKVALRAYQAIEYHDHVPLAMVENKLRLRRRTPDAERLAWAKQTVASLNGRLPNSRAEIYAQEAIYLDEKPEVEIILQAIRIGDLGITAIPNEVYGLTGLKIKAQSPLQPTFNIELANGAQGYVPPPEQHALGGYTTWPACTAGLEVGAEPKIVAALLGLLEKVAGKPRIKPEHLQDDYSRAVLASKPSAYWRLDDMQGEDAFDSSGNDCLGSYVDKRAFYLPGRHPGGMEYDEQIRNRAVYFAGGTVTGEFEELDSAYSVEFWFWNALPDDARVASTSLYAVQRDSVNGDCLSIVPAPTAGRVLEISNGESVRSTGKTLITPRCWHHVTLVRDGVRVSVYLDGNPKPDLAVEAELRLQKDVRLFFAGTGSPKNHFEGKLDDIAVYPRAIPAGEVARHFQAAGFAANGNSRGD